jgi:putative transposase
LKLVAQVKLLPSPEQAKALRETLRRFNQACNHISEIALAEQCFHKFALCRAAYRATREATGLTAQLTTRAIHVVSACYKRHKTILHRFKDAGAATYDFHVLRFIGTDRINLWTTDGRQTMGYVCGERQAALLKFQKGQSDLVLQDGEFYLHSFCDIPDGEILPVDSSLGVDLGVKNIAVDSDGTVFSGDTVNGIRHRHRRMRAKAPKQRHEVGQTPFEEAPTQGTAVRPLGESQHQQTDRGESQGHESER